MRGKRVRLIVAITLTLILSGVLAYQIYYRPYQAMDLREQLAQYYKLENELARIQDENLKLVMETRRLQKDKKYIEQLLRERGYIYPDEELQIMPPQTTAPHEAD